MKTEKTENAQRREAMGTNGPEGPKEIKKNYTKTEYRVNPGSSTNYSGCVNIWECGCVAASGGYRKLCSNHKSLPPILRQMREPVRVDALGRGTRNKNIPLSFYEGDTDDLKVVRRRVEDALRKGGTGQILRCAEILNTKIID